MKDAVSSVKTLVEAGWTKGNTGNRNIGAEINSEEVWNVGRVDARNNDWILYYYTSGNVHVRPDITNNLKDITGYVSIKITTAVSEAHAKLMIDEIIRICEVNRKTTDNSFSEMNIVRGPHATHTHSQAGGFWSYTIDCELVSWHNAKSDS